MMEGADVGIAPYVEPGADFVTEAAAMVQPIGKEQLREAVNTLRRYKAGKANFERRIIENEEFWKLRHWEHIQEQGTTPLKTKSAWLVNVILSKHADAMDALPEPNCLPRAADDEEEAKRLSSILPVVMQRNDFDTVWSDNWWKKLKAGVSIYGVFWDKDALNGLGDIAVRRIDPLTLFWEPGITDIQASRNVFHVSLMDNDLLEERYPELRDKLKGGKDITLNEYLYDDTVNTADKSPVIDWYYKKVNASGKSVLHYVKFVGDTVLYATENEAGSAGGVESSRAIDGDGRQIAGAAGDIPGFTAPGADTMTERGLYDHGLYPFFFDVLFPEEGTPTGYGYVDICKDPQRQIDLMNNAIVANCIAGATPRWMIRGEGGINEEEYADWTKPFVHVNGTLEERYIQQIQVQPLTGNYLNILDQKIAEMKETSGNRDVNNGGTPSGVTAASAIAAMQEQSGKLSRDQIQASYKVFSRIVYCVIELIRQFYAVPRQFRIIGPDGQAEYVRYRNNALQMQFRGIDPITKQPDIRLPVFDIEVNAQKQSAYNKLSYNELAIQFYQLGFFNPQAADPALAALEMMEFKGKEKVRQRIQQNAGLLQMLQQALMENQMLKARLGIPIPGADGPMKDGGTGNPPPTGGQAKLPETDAMGEQKKGNRYIERAKGQAQAATQPR